MAADFVVNISRLTQAVSQQGFGLTLILGTSGIHTYTEYEDITAVAEDFAITDPEYLIAARIFGQNPKPQKIAIYGIAYTSGTDPETDLTDALNTLVGTNNDWYHLVSTANTDDEITALSGWADTQLKMYWATTQTLALAASLESDRTFLMYHDSATAYVAEGLSALAATSTPGSLTFKFKTVTGVVAADITATELSTLHSNNGQSYIEKNGVLQTTEGKVTSGEYLDVMLGSDWIQVRMEETAAALAVNTPKIPYSNQGIAMLVAVVEKVLKQAVANDIILTDDNGNGVYTITAKRREEMATNDIVNRVYNGIEWEATLAGAVHTGTISGVLTY